MNQETVGVMMVMVVKASHGQNRVWQEEVEIARSSPKSAQVQNPNLFYFPPPDARTLLLRPIAWPAVIPYCSEHLC